MSHRILAWLALAVLLLIAPVHAQQPAEPRAPADPIGTDVQMWRQRIRGQIQQRMSVPPGVPQDARVELEVSLLPTGHVAVVSTARSSGIPDLDSALRRAVLAAAPLDLPADAEGVEKIRRFAVAFEPRSGVRVLDPAPQPGQPAAAAVPPSGERFVCTAPGPALAPDCSHSGSRNDLLTCFAQALQARVVKMVGACGPAAYPLEARKNRWEGTVQVGVTFERGGKFSTVAIAETSGQPVLDQRGMDMVREAILPAPPELFAAAFTVRVPIVFRMQQRPADAKPASRQM